MKWVHTVTAGGVHLNQILTQTPALQNPKRSCTVLWCVKEKEMLKKLVTMVEGMHEGVIIITRARCGDITFWAEILWVQCKAFQFFLFFLLWRVLWLRVLAIGSYRDFYLWMILLTITAEMTIEEAKISQKDSQSGRNKFIRIRIVKWELRSWSKLKGLFVTA